jgi:hypothetical protein
MRSNCFLVSVILSLIVSSSSLPPALYDDMFIACSINVPNCLFVSLPSSQGLRLKVDIIKASTTSTLIVVPLFF